jgi:hypothetical protein
MCCPWEVRLDGLPEPSDVGGVDPDPRISRLVQAVRRLGALGRPEAAESLAQTSEALDRLASTLDDDASPQARCGPAGMRGAVVGDRAAPWPEQIDAEGRLLTATVNFPDVSPEGNRWVDAGTVSMLLTELLGQLAGQQGGSFHQESLSVAFIAPAPRNRQLSIAARAEPTGTHELDVYASISDATHMLVDVHARFVRR